MFICVTVICILFFVCVFSVFFMFFVLFSFAAFSFSTLILLVGSVTCKNRLPYNLYCVGGDVKHCSINQSININCVVLFVVDLPINYVVWWKEHNIPLFPRTPVMTMSDCKENSDVKVNILCNVS